MYNPYLFLENGEGIRERDVIGVFHLDAVTQSEHTRKSLTDMQKSMRIVNVANDLPKSLVIVDEAYGSRMYLSGLSSNTIIKRLDTEG